MKKTKVEDRQSLLDVAIRTSGNLEALINLAEVNDSNPTDELAIGKELVTVKAIDTRHVRNYEEFGTSPATSLSDEDLLLTNEGINYWAVDIDFVIS